MLSVQGDERGYSEMRDAWRPRLRRALVTGVVAVVASTALVSVVQAARTGNGSRPAATGQYEKKETICHRTGSKKNPFVTIRVSRHAVPAHLRHGDKLGPCEGQTFKMCTTKAGKKQTIKVRFRALKSRLRKGDKLGPCKTKAKGKPAKGQNDKGKGKNENKGKSQKPPKRK
jgi:hypothetical protein